MREISEKFSFNDLLEYKKINLMFFIKLKKKNLNQLIFVNLYYISLIFIKAKP